MNFDHHPSLRSPPLLSFLAPLDVPETLISIVGVKNTGEDGHKKVQVCFYVERKSLNTYHAPAEIISVLNKNIDTVGFSRASMREKVSEFH